MENVVRFSPEFSIKKNIPVPYYHQLATYILGEIESGRWTPQQKLPPEAEFCEHRDISRTVVRQALAGFQEDMERRGFRATTRVLKQEAAPASRMVAEKLYVEIGTPVHRGEPGKRLRGVAARD